MAMQQGEGFLRNAVVVGEAHVARRQQILALFVNDTRLAEQREYLLTASDMSFTYNHGIAKEPFALLHRH